MKSITKHIVRFVPILFLLGMLGCDTFLEEAPDNRVALNDFDKASQVLTNAYSAASPAFTDWMSDDVGWTRGTNIRPNHEQLYSWEDNTSDPTEQDSPIYFWFSTYDAIAHANEVLAVIDEMPVNTDKEKAHKRAVKGEALLARAYGHFMLVNLFGQHYGADFGSNLGVPYVTTPETNFIATYDRLSVNRVYDKVEDDLVEGLELIDDSFYSNSGKYHFNKNAALAFASRFYLFKGDFIRCIDYSSQMLGGDPSNFVRDMTSDVFQEAKSSIQGYPQLYSSPDLPSNLMLMRKVSLVQRTDFAFGPTDAIYDEIFGPRPFAGTIDERENPAFVKGENALYPLRYQSLFERSSLNSNTGLPYHIAIPFRGEEVLLNRAEAYAFQNDIELALADLQVLTDKRYSGAPAELTIDLLREWFGPSYVNTSDREIVLIYLIFVERRKEFVAQGMRWFDVKRFGLSVVHDYANGSTITLEQEDLRKAIQIPKSAIDVGGLKENPR